MPAESSNQNQVAEKLRAAEALIAEALGLLGATSKSGTRQKAAKASRQAAPRSIRFNMNERAFVKNVARSLGSGPRRFVALVAYLTKGKLSVQVDTADVKKVWNRNKAKDMLGMGYNHAYATRAKSEGWVNPRKRGLLELDESWRDAFADE